MLGGLSKLLAECDRAAPELGPSLGIYEDRMEQLAGEGSADREQANRNEDGERAFVRMIAAAAGGDVVRAVRAVAMFVVGRVMVAVERVLDMLRRGPARLAEEGQEDQAPRVEAGQQRGEGAGPESDRPGHRPARPG